MRGDLNAHEAEDGLGRDLHELAHGIDLGGRAGWGDAPGGGMPNRGREKGGEEGKRAGVVERRVRAKGPEEDGRRRSGEQAKRRAGGREDRRRVVRMRWGMQVGMQVGKGAGML